MVPGDVENARAAAWLRCGMHRRGSRRWLVLKLNDDGRHLEAPFRGLIADQQLPIDRNDHQLDGDRSLVQLHGQQTAAGPWHGLDVSGGRRILLARAEVGLRLLQPCPHRIRQGANAVVVTAGHAGPVLGKVDALGVIVVLRDQRKELFGDRGQRRDRWRRRRRCGSRRAGRPTAGREEEHRERHHPGLTQQVK